MSDTNFKILVTKLAAAAVMALKFHLNIFFNVPLNNTHDIDEQIQMCNNVQIMEILLFGRRWLSCLANVARRCPCNTKVLVNANSNTTFVGE